MTGNSAVYTCPTCGLEVVGLVTPPYEYLCTGAPGHGHAPVPVARIQDIVARATAEVREDAEQAAGGGV